MHGLGAGIMLLAAVALAPQSLAQTTLYFDAASGNGLGTGSGSTTWNSSTWNTAASGNGTRVAWTNGRLARFNAGSGTYSVNVTTAATTFAGVIVDQGNVTISSSGSGTLALSANSTFTVTSGSLDISTAFSGGFNVTKAGANTLTLTNTDTYTGSTTISAGILQLGNGTTNGNLTGTSSVINNATLAFNENSATTFSKAITGTGAVTVSGGGAAILTNTGNTYTGATTINSGATLQLGNGTTNGNLTGTSGVANSGTLAFNENSATTFSKAITGTGALTVSGGGTAILTNTGDSYTGATTINSGATLQLGNGTTNGNLTGTSGVANSGTLAFNENSATTFNRAISGSGAVTVSGGAVTTFNVANTYTGTTTINSGATLNIQNATALGTGTAGTTVNSGGALELQSVSGISATNGVLTISGNGVGGNGALRNVSGSNTWNDSITLAGAATITSSTTGNLLTVGTYTTTTVTTGSNTLTVDGAGDIKFKANLGASSGSTGGFIKNGTGTTTFNGDINYYTGTTTVNAGTLVLDTYNNYVIPDNAIQGNLVIGTGTGAANSVKVMYGTGSASNKIANGSQITIYSDGKLDMNGDRNGNSDTVGALVFYGGHIDTGTGGLLSITGDVTTHTNTANQAATIDGHLDLNGLTRTFTVDNGGIASDLTVNATINSGSFIKEGTGVMTITSNNSYTGTTAVNHGILNIQDSNALGAHGASDGASGTTVGSGAALQLQKNTADLAVGAEALSLNGSGYNNADGALRNVSGNNSWSGTVTLAGNARINTESGSSLTMSGDFTATTQTLTVGGGGDTTLSGAIGTGTGGIIKDGSGSLTLSGTGANSFSGGLNVQDGTVYLSKTSGLNATGTGSVTIGGSGSAVVQLNQSNQIADSAAVTINAGGKLDLNGNSETIGSLSGTGAGTLALGSGSLIVGNATSTSYSGAITGTSTALITKQGSGTLTLSGDINYGGNVTVTGTAGNTLAFTGNIPSIAGELTLGAGTTLALNLTGATHTLTIDTLHITGNTTIDFGASSNSILNVNNLIIDSGVTLVSIINWTNASDFFFAQSWTGATLNTVGAGNPEIQITFSGYSPTQTAWLGNNPWTGYNQITPAPEPATYGFILMAAGVALVGYRRLRFGRKTAG